MHTRNLLRAAAAVLLAGIGVAHAQDVPAETTQARKAIERSLPFLEKEADAWIAARNCVSCHHVPFALWSHNAARASGITIDEKKRDGWADWSWKYSQTRRQWFKLADASLKKADDDVVPADVRIKLKQIIDKPVGTEKEFLIELESVLTRDELDRYGATLVKRATQPLGPLNDGGGLDTVSQLVLGRARDAGGEQASAFLADMQDLIIRWQRPDGSWKAAGQLPSQARPEDESNVVTTMWATLALASLEKPQGPAADAIKRAAAFLKTAKPGTTNEWLIGASLVERKFGEKERAAGMLEELLKRQNADGGWAWQKAGESNAFATGQTLYALSESGVSRDSGPVSRARNYLIQTQTSDGSWPEASRGISSASNDARLKGVAPIYRYWGTAWAVIGLSQSQP